MLFPIQFSCKLCKYYTLNFIECVNNPLWLFQLRNPASCSLLKSLACLPLTTPIMVQPLFPLSSVKHPL